MRTTLLVSIIVLLTVAALPMPYGYYGFLRLTVPLFCFLLVLEDKVMRDAFGFSSAFILAVAILFNPVVPVHFSRQAWIFIDLLSAALFLAIWRSERRFFSRRAK